MSVYRYGHNDPTTRLDATTFWRATITPNGPGTLHLRWSSGQIEAEAWGDGARWLLDGVSDLVGAHDTPFTCTEGTHPVVVRAARNHAGLRIGASRSLYHELLPNVLGQRVTAREAIGQWHRLCIQLGEPAPGPHPDLRLPPAPERLRSQPAWWFHPLGIETKRAEALRTVARHAQRIEEWAALAPVQAAQKLHLLRGIGPWTIGSALGPALGDPDAVPVGDYHIPNMVSWALARRARGNDEQMLQLLAPFAGERGKVIRLLGMDGHAAPKFGPRQRIQPMYRR